MPTSIEPLTIREVACSPTLLIATWFGLGLAPVASGTVGSLAALAFVWLVMQLWMPLALLLCVFLLFLGVATGRVLGLRMGEPDHGAIVVDEVVGVALAIFLTWEIRPLWGIASHNKQIGYGTKGGGARTIYELWGHYNSNRT